MHASKISRMARIAPAIGFWRGLKNQNLSARMPRRDRRTQRGVATADHHYVVL
jgi:hypothetical protein